MKRARQPVLITDAQRSPGDQLRRREIRYAIMMGLRTLCVVLAGVLVIVNAPLLGLWLPLCGIGMVLLPWLAVILANDSPPRAEHRLANRLRHAPRPEHSGYALPAARDDHPVIDAE